MKTLSELPEQNPEYEQAVRRLSWTELIAAGVVAALEMQQTHDRVKYGTENAPVRLLINEIRLRLDGPTRGQQIEQKPESP